MNELESYNEFEAQMKTIEESANFLPDTSTKEGYEKSKRIGLDGRKVYNAVDKVRKQLGEDARAMVKLINDEGNSHLKRIDASVKPHVEAYKNHDAEIKRQKELAEQAFSNEIAKFSDSVVGSHGMTSSEVGALIEEMNNHPLEFGNRTIEAGRARDSAVSQLTAIKSSKILQEAEAERLEKEKAEFEAQQEEARKAQAIIDEANRIEREKQEAAQAIINEKNRAEEESQRAAQAKVDEEKRQAEEAVRIEQAKLDAAKAERDRIERESAMQKEIDEAKARDEKLLAEKKAANKAHRKSIENEASKDLVEHGFRECDIPVLIELISDGRVSNIQINY